jgi:tetratricopeptide (TPR) repeat protein
MPFHRRIPAPQRKQIWFKREMCKSSGLKHDYVFAAKLLSFNLVKQGRLWPLRTVKHIRGDRYQLACSALLLLLCVASCSCFCQIPSSLQEKLDSHARLAQQYLKEQRPELATREFQEIILLDPNNVDARGNLGVLLFFSANYSDAAPQLRTALTLRPDLWKIQALLGMCERRMGAETDGREDLEAAFPHLQQDKIRRQAGEELIASYSSTGELDKAQAIRDELAKSDQTMAQEPGQNQMTTSDSGAYPLRQERFAGDSVCLSCHQQVSISYLHTAHHLTSQLPGKDSILGSFIEGSNVLMIHQPTSIDTRPSLYFKMEEKGDGNYETAIMGVAPHVQTESERIDLVIGSGIRGQSYLYWQGNALYELPVSYWSAGRRWINSPGYADGTANFARAIHPRCLECHLAYIKPLATDPRINRYDRGSVATGISCETCHGPGMDHITVMRTASAASPRTLGSAIINPAMLSRDRQVDLCALCHNGTRSKEIAPAFSYRPGEPLHKYVIPDPADPAEHPDVHGDQVGLLKRSKCYLQSPNMTCSTCHDVHAPERTAASYSNKCLTCHSWESCGVSKKMGRTIANNCIDCHMPVEPTKLIVSETAGKLTRASMRNHWIKVYPGAQ